MKMRKLIFMIHKHSASKLHYDFRFEIDGKLKSWALKELPLVANKPSLAILVPDHPFWYRHFEGVIPEGQYGAGPVMVWDKGLYDNILNDDSNLQDCIDRGFLFIRLDGHKLKGNYLLVRVSNKQRWLMIKLPDEFIIKGRKPKWWDKSVKTGRTLQEILDQHK